MPPTPRRTSALLAAALVVAGCTGDAKVVNTRTERRYCELAGQLQDTAAGFGVATAAGTFQGSPEAVQRLLAQMGGTVDEMTSSAPSEVRGDVRTLVRALEEARDGDPEALRSTEVSEATGKINAFRARACPPPSSSGDG